MSRRFYIIYGAALAVGCVVASCCGLGLVAAWKFWPRGELYERAEGVPEIKDNQFDQSLVGSKVIVFGTVHTGTFEGWEGKRLLNGEDVSARMFLEFEKSGSFKVICQFVPTSDRKAIPSIGTKIRVVGRLDWISQAPDYDGAKTVALKECKFVR